MIILYSVPYLKFVLIYCLTFNEVQHSVDGHEKHMKQDGVAFNKISFSILQGVELVHAAMTKHRP